MSILDLTKRYKRQKSRQAVNAAIREEIPGGAETLDLGTKYSGRLTSLRAKQGGAQPSLEEVYAEIYADLQRLRDVMGDEIARRYGLKPKLDSQPQPEGN